MIDYEKLKIAYELAEKYRSCGNYISIQTHFNEDDSGITHYYNLYENRGEFPLCQGTIDDLIIKLQKLTAPKSKYRVGDTTFLIDADTFAIKSFLIRDMKNYKTSGYDYWLYEGELEGDKSIVCKKFSEHILYPTKSSLIEAQIAYWTAQREPECQHEYENNFANDSRPRFEKIMIQNAPNAGSFINET